MYATGQVITGLGGDDDKPTDDSGLSVITLDALVHSAARLLVRPRGLAAPTAATVALVEHITLNMRDTQKAVIPLLRYVITRLQNHEEPRIKSFQSHRLRALRHWHRTL